MPRWDPLFGVDGCDTTLPLHVCGEFTPAAPQLSASVLGGAQDSNPPKPVSSSNKKHAHFTAPTFQPVLPTYNLATLSQVSHTVSHFGGGRTSCPILFDLATKSFAQFTSAASTRGLLCTRRRESKQAYHCNRGTSTFKAPSATIHLSPPTFISAMKSPPEAVKSMRRAVLLGSQPARQCMRTAALSSGREDCRCRMEAYPA